MNQIELCRFIATVAHKAKGQKRADGWTPFIAHPRRVAELVESWFERNLDRVDNVRAISAAWLHDVVEDTGITLDDLRSEGVYRHTIEIVDLLTKKNPSHEREDADYYAAIMTHPTAKVVKAFDRMANLEDALSEVIRLQGLKVGRWKNYVHATYSDVLPLYADMPDLYGELHARLQAIEHALIEVRGGDPNGVFDCGVAVK